jgi:hypothetical protein
VKCTIAKAVRSFIKHRVSKVSTVIGLVLIYLLCTSRSELADFVKWVMNDALRKLLSNIVNDSNFITIISGALAAYLIGTKKF